MQEEIWRVVAILMLMMATAPGRTSTRAPAPVYGYKTVATYPHSTSNFTEGLAYLDGKFYEGTGLYDQSSLMSVDMNTGRVIMRRDLSPQYFGEGITIWRKRIYQLTWRSHRCFVYDLSTFRLLKTFTYPGEGWGMTSSDSQVVTSDGTATLAFRDPESFRVVRRIVVKDGISIIDHLNELEFVRGEIYANIWHSDMIARISPRDGRVIAWIDCSGLMKGQRVAEGASVFNGIAYDKDDDKLFVTGKNWPLIFEIQVARKLM